MVDGLLIIENGKRSVESSMVRRLAREEGLCCEQGWWDSFEPEILLRNAVGLIVVVADAGSGQAMNLFRWLRLNPVSSPSFAILPADSATDLLGAASDATDDFMVSPIHQNELRLRMKRLLVQEGPSVDSLERRLSEELGLAQIIGEDPAFVQVIQKIPLIAAADVPVLLTGETGTGKELCARAIHHLSRRQGAPFIPVECGAFPEHLVENELFGHVRGAFTDAHADQKGLVAMAERGTLFLDEIDTLTVGVQSKLLRFLQEHTYRSLGAQKFERADVRIIAATNRDIEGAVREKHMRSDLYYRMNVLRLHLPALRERPADIPILACHFLNTYCRSAGLPRKCFSSGSLAMLSRYEWPGNVRELLNVVQRTAILTPAKQILPSHLSLQESSEEASGPLNFRQARAASIAEFERQYVERMLQKHSGNVTRAAIEAGKDRRAFGRLVKKYNLRGPLFRRRRVTDDPPRDNSVPA